LDQSADTTTAYSDGPEAQGNWLNPKVSSDPMLFCRRQIN